MATQLRTYDKTAQRIGGSFELALLRLLLDDGNRPYNLLYMTHSVSREGI